ncbi:MAG: hypothetical protein ACP5UV_00810 [Thermoplasmata archaeon]
MVRKMRLSENIIMERYRLIQEIIGKKGLDAAVIRTMSTLIYITGNKMAEAKHHNTIRARTDGFCSRW